ncbi:hypothetical protein K1T71_000034 [Dendrolimus kikuchii]|uniref:Uncharacterized protein n=1 Tax=Dendrolimus kikuchii TaxID=765133 RepID=A0ACC1DI90_9NEOP|nr:hypothetical protein K1T71_000034 [Dendrolimus kikuchii]
MLKISNSFCRYVLHACEPVDCKTHVRKIVHLNFKRKTCGTVCAGGERHLYTGSLLRKKARIKSPSFKSNESRRTGPMSDLQPNTNCVSCGGKFSVKRSPPENRSVENWRTRYDDSSSADDTENQEPHQVPPDFRVWESVGDKSSNSNMNTFRFKVMSYNVLAQYLLECHPYLYRDCVPRNLKWKVRASRLFEEITTLSPDPLLCFCDMGLNAFLEINTTLVQDGCAGLTHRLSRCAGCITMFSITVEFYQPELPILNRDNIGIIVKLVPCNNPGSPIVVATTHLLYNPKRTDVRLAQIQVFLAEIDRFAYYSNGNECGHFPIILTGDLNSKPESAVIKLLDKGHVRASFLRDCSDWQRIGVTDNCQHLSVYLNRKAGQSTDYTNIKIYNSEYCTTQQKDGEVTEQSVTNEFSEMFNSGEIGHSLVLGSVYDKCKPDGSKEASTFQDYWVTVDYIYFSCKSNLRLVERLRLPSVSECEVLGCLPNDVYGSDHLALAAIFELYCYESDL